MFTSIIFIESSFTLCGVWGGFHVDGHALLQYATEFHTDGHTPRPLRHGLHSCRQAHPHRIVVEHSHRARLSDDSHVIGFYGNGEVLGVLDFFVVDNGDVETTGQGVSVRGREGEIGGERSVVNVGC